MNLPVFRPTAAQKAWIQGQRATAAFIRTFWTAASTRQRKDPEFLWYLTACAWTNIRADGSGDESTREWRNRILAAYLGVEYQSIDTLADALCRDFPKLTTRKARRLLATHTGITHHYTAIRPRTRQYVLRHASQLGELFRLVASRGTDPEAKIESIAGRLSQMPEISTPRGGRTSPFNPLTPVLACLDPRRRFPIMNQRTHRLLRAVGKDHDSEGAIALYSLIGTHGLTDSFSLDVYSQVAEAHFEPAARTPRHPSQPHPRTVSIKSELDSLAKLAARRVTVRKEHNKLTNRFRRAVFANVTPQESNFDLLIDGWRGKRKLLIEAKTDWKGTTGRTQIRQAIGQLFDYRLQHFGDQLETVDLAVLVPTQPNVHIMRLLQSLEIHVLWFKERRLGGTIALQ